MSQSDKKKILILGAKGMLGTDLVKLLSGAYDVVPMDIQELDITKREAVAQAIDKIKPGVVINCAAYTDVDGCESKPEVAFAVNAEGARNVALACKAAGAKMVHYSTDYIFDGEKYGPYVEDDQPRPLNVYGESKLRGEGYIRETLDDHAIIRTTWLFGRNGKNFVRTILKLAQERPELRVVHDQFGSPTYAPDLSRATKLLIEAGGRGTFHVTNRGSCTWFVFARKILELSGKSSVKTMPIGSGQLSRPAIRPKNSVFDCGKFSALTGFEMPKWEDALADYLKKG